MVCTSYLLHHVFPSPSPWSLLGQWREYVCLYFLHVLFRPQLRLVSFFFCCLNNPCCIYKQNLSFKNHRFFFFQLQSHLCILATCTSSIIHLVCSSKFCYRQTICPLESGDPGYLPFIWENRKFWLENEMVRAIPFGQLPKIWAVIWGDEIFLLFSWFWFTL